MGTLSPIHWMLVAVVILMLFGPNTLSRLGRTAGRSVRTIAKVKQDLTSLPAQAMAQPAKKASPPEPTPPQA